MAGTKNRRRTPEDKKYIIENFKDMSMGDLVENTGLTKQQIYLTIREAKKEIDSKIEASETEEEKMELLSWKEENLPDGRSKQKSKYSKSTLASVLEELGEFTLEHTN